MLAVIILMVLVGVNLGCATHNHGRVVATEVERDFFLKMFQGYERDLPDQEDALYTKGWCTMEGKRCAVFAWKDGKQLFVTIKGVMKQKGRIQISERNPEMPCIVSSDVWGGRGINGGGNCWIKEFGHVAFTWVFLRVDPSAGPLEVHQRLKTIESSGVIRKIEVLLPQR